MLSDPSQHFGADFIPIVEGPSVVRVPEAAQLFMRSALRNDGPPYAEERLTDDSGPGAGPITHAMA